MAPDSPSSLVGTRGGPSGHRGVGIVSEQRTVDDRMSAEALAGVTGLAGLVGGCVRVVPSTLKDGAADEWLAAHKEYHSPAVRRQPGFVAKVLLQAESDPNQVAMLLVWRSTEDGLTWTKHPEHDAVGAPISPFTRRDAGPQTGLPRGGYRVLDAVLAG
jgi:heme-degrading monooxygenase HmoA